jgi:hypothetical protein
MELGATSPCKKKGGLGQGVTKLGIHVKKSIDKVLAIVTASYVDMNLSTTDWVGRYNKTSRLLEKIKKQNVDSLFKNSISCPNASLLIDSGWGPIQRDWDIQKRCILFMNRNNVQAHATIRLRVPSFKWQTCHHEEEENEIQNLVEWYDEEEECSHMCKNQQDAR